MCAYDCAVGRCVCTNWSCECVSSVLLYLCCTRISTLSEEENAVRLQRQREQARLRMQALRRKRLEIAALHSPVVSDTSGNPKGYLQCMYRCPSCVWRFQ